MEIIKWCLSIYKCTKLKAIHNAKLLLALVVNDVYLYTNVLNWKQFTTDDMSCVVYNEMFIYIQMY